MLLTRWTGTQGASKELHLLICQTGTIITAVLFSAIVDVKENVKLTVCHEKPNTLRERKKQNKKENPLKRFAY